MRNRSLHALCLLLFTCLPANADEPLGYFTNVRPLPGINAGPWRDSVGSVSPDQLEIYFTSDYGANPQPSFGNMGPALDLYVARRGSRDERFGKRERLDPTTAGVFDGNPIISSDGLQLTFDSERSGSPSGGDASWISSRPSIDAPWSEPVLATEYYPFEGSGAATTNLLMPSFSSDGNSMVFVNSDGPNADYEDLYIASRSSTEEPFTDIVALDGINRRGTRERRPDLSFDGRTLFFERIQLNFQSPEIQVAHRDSTDDPFETSTNIDGFSMGSRSAARHPDAQTVDFAAATFTPHISPDWPADGSKLYFGSACCSTDWTIYEATWRQATPIPGDMTSDGILGADDIDLISKAVRLGVNAPGFDLNADERVDTSDRDYWVQSLATTWYGDSNLDSEFNSADLIVVFQAGQYEDGVSLNSDWTSGDWNGDAEFDSADLILAFQGGGYEQGLLQAVSAVPEPSSILMLIAGWLAIALGRRAPGQLQTTPARNP